MKKYVKSQSQIDAIQFDNTPENIKEIKNLSTPQCVISYVEDGDNSYVTIKTLEGLMRADIGDYIIKGVKGELYPCKPDIFELTYRCTDNFLDRLILEATELGDKIAKLTNFMTTDVYNKLPWNSQKLLATQLTTMHSYYSILDLRIHEHKSNL